MVVKGTLLQNKVEVKENIEDVYSEKYYGKIMEIGGKKYLELSLNEAMHLIDKGEMELKEKGKKLNREKAYERFCEIDPEFPQKYAVYSDLRERGYIVKSGFKFGTHFRVYSRGINPYKEGPKEQKEHTKWVVHAVPENYTLSYQEMSRSVRLAQNIRTKMLWAVVDSEGEVTYYEFIRIRP